MVVEYIGEKVRQIVADIREETYDKEGVGSCYLFRLDKDHIIDATRTGGMARYDMSYHHLLRYISYFLLLSSPSPIPQLFSSIKIYESLL